VYPDVVGRAGLSQPAAHGMQNIMLRRRAGTDAPYLHHRQHRDAPLNVVKICQGLDEKDMKKHEACFSQWATEWAMPTATESRWDS